MPQQHSSSNTGTLHHRHPVQWQGLGPNSGALHRSGVSLPLQGVVVHLGPLRVGQLHLVIKTFELS